MNKFPKNTKKLTDLLVAYELFEHIPMNRNPTQREIEVAHMTAAAFVEDFKEWR